MDVRKQFGWDRPAGAYILSKGLTKRMTQHTFLPQCLNQALSTLSTLTDMLTKGSWLLHMCIGRLGIPLTPNGGFHSMGADTQV